jgi:GrpB-like predicted nucleotidyltransferase (UPF0157 family)
VGQWVEEVEHVGSTAIPGLDAKPVIDLIVGLEHMAYADSCVEPLTNLGYSYWAEGAELHHHLFVRFVDLAMSALHTTCTWWKPQASTERSVCSFEATYANTQRRRMDTLS